MILPLDLNKKLQDKPPSKKLKRYRKTGLLTAIEVASVSRWSKRAVRKREETILQWATQEWTD